MESVEPVKSRHGVMAEDSVRVSVVIPRTMLEELKGKVGGLHPNVSCVIRNYIVMGMANERAKA